MLGTKATGQSVGGFAGAPLRMGFGAKGIGMANATVAWNNGDVVGYNNPALVPFQETATGAVSVGVLSLDRSLNFLSYTQRLKPSAGLSFGIINAGVGDIQGRDRDGDVTEKYSTSENAFAFSFGLKMSDDLSIGVTTKILYYSLFSEVSSTTDQFPIRKRFGVTYTPEEIGLTFSFESELISSMALHRFGVEVKLIDPLIIRGGVDQISISRQVTSKPSFGITFQPPWTAWRPGIHYAFVLEPYSPGGIHFISVSLSFP